MSRLPIASVVVAASLCAAAAFAQCRPSAVGPCVIDLRGDGAPRAAKSCSEETWESHLSFDLPQRFADADDNGWHETVVVLDLDPKRGCGCAVFRITYDGVPLGHTVNIGDSPTNDGHGGDEWSTSFDAELMILGRDLTAFGSERPGSLSDSQIFGLRGLPIVDRVLELEICDQSVRFAIDPGADEPGVYGFFNTYTSRELIAIREEPKDEASRATAPDARIYAAFNRVIHRRAGRPARDRFGAGVRRVEILLTP